MLEYCLLPVRHALHLASFCTLGQTPVNRLQSCHWLQLQAANGLAIPYISYLELGVALCGKVIPHCGILVVKDLLCVVSSGPGFLGMKVICRCYRELFGVHGLSFFDLPAVAQAPGSVSEALQQ